MCTVFFFFNDTATTEIYTLSLHDALPILATEIAPNVVSTLIVFVPLIVANAILTEAGLSYLGAGVQDPNPSWGTIDRKSTRLNSSHANISYAVFCLKKKKTNNSKYHYYST